MSMDIRPLNEKTVEDFKEVVRARFSEKTISLVDKVLSNPVRVEGQDSGAIGYVDGVPQCVRASIFRRVYWKKKAFIGVVGGMLAKKHGAERTLLNAVVKNSISPREDSKIFFTNTSVKACVRLNREAGVEGEGPQTWLVRKYVVFRPFIRIWSQMAAVHPRLPKPHLPPFVLPLFSGEVSQCANGIVISRELELEHEEMDLFWNMYLERNEGLVSSRSAAELNWAYGDRLKDGNVVFLALRRKSQLLGYIAASCGGSQGYYWRLIDWIALENDTKILELLMNSMVKYIKKNTPAVQFQIDGYPVFVQSIIKKITNKQVSMGHNPYLFHCYDADLKREIFDVSNNDKGWFWGAYDGDLCME